MDCFYITIECKIGDRQTYGIAAVDCTEEEKCILESLIDVADDRATAERYAEWCNRERIPLEQFRDAVAEYIGREE
ncbi:MAG: hypothetical protein II768_02635 [Clostridia bacterium]|nr:hypothetical protein [Clostridia bacterium]